MPQGSTQAMDLNAILVSGSPVIEEMEVETSATQFCPGKLVIAGTADYQCAVAPTTSAIVIGVADVPSDQKLTAYYVPSAGGAVTKGFTAADQIRVLHGDCVVKLIGLSGQTIVVGTKVISAANGMIQAGATAGQCIGYSLENATVRLSTKCDWVLVKLII